jgi:ATP-dependent DNA ligase
MLSRVAAALPEQGDFLFEPKWDGFRAIVFRHGDEAQIQSRDLRSLNRYFPELVEAFEQLLPEGCVLDGEIVIAGAKGLDFDALQQRVHPAESRVTRLARETPASFVAFDLLALDGADTTARPQAERRMLLEALLWQASPPLHLTPMTTDRATAQRWLEEFEGAGLDGVMAKHADLPYRPDERAMFKVKHVRTADCVVAGFRWHKSGNDAIGSLLLGLYDDDGVLQHVGSCASFAMATRYALAKELATLHDQAATGHPWASWGSALEAGGGGQRIPGAQSRWSGGKNLAWEPLRIERVCEVRYDHLQGRRFRHPAVFMRWRIDKRPQDCRFDQLEVVQPYALAEVFRGAVTA